MNSPANYIYGRHALEEALASGPQTIKKVYFSRAMDDRDLRNAVMRAGITIAELKEHGKGTHVDSNVSHQGVVAQVDLERLMLPYKEFISSLSTSPTTALILLDELTDPHNVGAIIRSAGAFGIAGVLIPPHRQAPVTAAVVKVSAGMAFKVPLVAITNINSTIDDLKKRGFWIYGLAGEGSKPLAGETFSAPSVLVLGNEAHGIREKTREHCDVLLSIPMHPRCESLNVAASTAIALYAWSQGHADALA